MLVAKLDLATSINVCNQSRIYQSLSVSLYLSVEVAQSISISRYQQSIEMQVSRFSHDGLIPQFCHSFCHGRLEMSLVDWLSQHCLLGDDEGLIRFFHLVHHFGEL